jgi:hypothetical protein
MSMIAHGRTRVLLSEERRDALDPVASGSLARVIWDFETILKSQKPADNG